jgi:subtilisin family serine protease
LVDAAAAVAGAVGESSPFPEVAELGGNNWGLDGVNAPEAWAQGYTGQGVVVAVVDSGVDYNHSDLSGNIWVNSGEIADNGVDDDGNGFIDDVRGWDFFDGDNDPMDSDVHGTHIAGTIAAENNGFGVTGVAYNATIMPVRVIDSEGGTISDIAAGIRYAADNGADVINLSLGGYFPSTEREEAIRYASDRGVVVVMAAGNEGASQPVYPARYATDWGIAVGAVDSNKTLANFSNRAGATPLDYVVAPGVDILSTTPGNSYQSFDGTSMATPHVAGVAALILSANPNLTPAEVESLLTQTANRTGITV